MKTKHVLCVVLLAGLLPASATAQRLASQKKGLGAVTGYQLGQVDNVSLLTGAATFVLPLGVSYKVGPGLAYQLTLTGRSKA